MLNVKCNYEERKCPVNSDICCQFCEMSYLPCEGKCPGCWDYQATEGDNHQQSSNYKFINQLPQVSIS